MSPVEFYSREERKVNGVFYTPTFLAEYLARKIVKYFGNRKIATANSSTKYGFSSVEYGKK